MKVSLVGYACFVLSLAVATTSLQNERVTALISQGERLDVFMASKQAIKVDSLGMLRSCEAKCINFVLEEAKNFNEVALKQGDCMFTNNDGDDELLTDSEGNIYPDEEDCDTADGNWIEDIRGGPVDVFKNGYTAFRAKDGGAIKMFFTVIAQGFYLVKSRLITALSLHNRIRNVWMEIRQSATSSLGGYPFRTEKRSLYDKARSSIQDLLSQPINSICGVLPALSISFIIGTTISMSELCASAMTSLVNHFLGWMKKQIKNMIKNMFKAKGKADLGKTMVKVLMAPLGHVFKMFENDVMKKTASRFGKIFTAVKDILNDLQHSRVHRRHTLLEKAAAGYCWDSMNNRMFDGPEKFTDADKEFSAVERKVTYKTKPVIDGLDEAIEEHLDLFTGYENAKTIEDKIERVVYVASLVFDPRVANVWTSDMLDALITNIMTQFSQAMATPKKRAELDKAASASLKHLSSNGLTTRGRFLRAMQSIENERQDTIEEMEAIHEKKMSEIRAMCWKDVKGAECRSLYMKLKSAKSAFRPRSWFAGFGKKSKKDVNPVSAGEEQGDADNNGEATVADDGGKEKKQQGEMDALLETTSGDEGIFGFGRKNKKKATPAQVESEEDTMAAVLNEEDKENDGSVSTANKRYAKESRSEDGDEPKPAKKRGYFATFKRGLKGAAKGVARGVKGAAKGVARGVKGAAKGVARGVKGAAKGVARGAKGVANKASGLLKKKPKQESAAVKAVRAELTAAGCPSEKELEELHDSLLEVHQDVHLDEDKERHFSL